MNIKELKQAMSELAKYRWSKISKKDRKVHSAKMRAAKKICHVPYET